MIVDTLSFAASQAPVLVITRHAFDGFSFLVCFTMIMVLLLVAIRRVFK